MKTAKEMRKYAKKFHNTFLTVRAFKMIENALFPDEEVLVSFAGTLDHKAVWKWRMRYAFALTDHRLIYAHNKPMSFKTETETIDLKSLNNVAFNKDIIRCSITFNALKKTFYVRKFARSGRKIFKAVNICLGEHRKHGGAPTTPAPTAADELIKLKQLLDQGAITQKEYNKLKKKHL